ncbi:protein EXECUTER 1, chloroplastic-like isoform X2 [Apium graveolens]|uniref:protein EXECUTER 1, chloroplastic-like isoform X2 n=1 Tax=Apium graveolens TaxID=4045 RepID=UPI003D7BFFA0
MASSSSSLSTKHGLEGWWFSVCQDGKDPYGHIIQIKSTDGNYLAISYSPWQLATANEGTPLFEICAPMSEEGEDKEKAIYLKHKAAPQDGKGKDSNVQLALRVFQLTPSFETSQDQWAETLKKLAVSGGKTDANKETFMKLLSKHQINPKSTKAATNSSTGDSDEKDQTVIWIDFSVGGLKENNTRKLEKELLQVPGTLERKGYFKFCLTVEEDKDLAAGDDILKGYRTLDHTIFDKVECIGKGKPEKNEDAEKFWQLIRSRALNKQPCLSGLTMFNRIDVTTSSDPLTGLYLCSNGYIVTEVIQITRKYGQWRKDGELENLSKNESDDYVVYVEAVKLTGDPELPAGKVAFRVKVGDKYKLHPGSVLEEKFGAVYCLSLLLKTFNALQFFQSYFTPLCTICPRTKSAILLCHLLLN